MMIPKFPPQQQACESHKQRNRFPGFSNGVIPAVESALKLNHTAALWMGSGVATPEQVLIPISSFRNQK